MPRGRPADYKKFGDPSSGLKPGARKPRANDARKQGMSRASEASGGRSTTRGKSGGKSLPSQASSTARKMAFGKQGARKRKK